MPHCDAQYLPRGQQNYCWVSASILCTKFVCIFVEQCSSADMKEIQNLWAETLTMSRFFNVIRFSLNLFLQKEGCTVAKFGSISGYLAGMFYTISYIMQCSFLILMIYLYWLGHIDYTKNYLSINVCTEIKKSYI